jgi:hypothetical protein
MAIKSVKKLLYQIFIKAKKNFEFKKNQQTYLLKLKKPGVRYFIALILATDMQIINEINKLHY